MIKCFLMLAVSLVSFFGSAQHVTLADLPGSELGLLLDVTPSKNVVTYYVFQYEQPVFDVSQATGVTLVQATSNMVKIKSGTTIITFSINRNYSNPAETVYYGYGLSKKVGAFQLVVPATPIFNLMEAITWQNRFANDLTCHSGGEGSTECTTGSLSSSCSVKCDTGFYACCDDTKNECRCKEKKAKKAKTLVLSAD